MLCAVLVLLAVCPTALAQATYPSEFRLSWCAGTECFDYSLSAAHFQLRLARYYSQGARPPLREAFFMATLPAPFQKELLFGCPGAMVLAHLLLAEARLYTHPPEEAAELVRRAQAMLAMPEIAGVHALGIQGAWPLASAIERFEATSRRLAGREPLSLDIVLPHCREDLSWLSGRPVLPRRTRLFVYEKCGGDANVTALMKNRLTVLQESLEDAPDPRTGMAARRDECTAYLSHVVRGYGDLGDVVLFLHGDPTDHTPLGLIDMVLQAVALGTLDDLGFLHLGAPRMVATANPCQATLFQAAVGRPMESPLYTYCCSQFVVSKSRIRSRPRGDYERMLRLVDGSVPDSCDRIGPSYERYHGQRLSHCFFFEFMWHVVFGEAEDLPLRGDDQRLPSAFRLKDNEESVPSVWKSYLGSWVAGSSAFANQGHEHWLQQLLSAGPLEDRKQVNFGDFVQGAA